MLRHQRRFLQQRGMGFERLHASEIKSAYTLDLTNAMKQPTGQFRTLLNRLPDEPLLVMSAG